jgi:hypothetical protein
MSTAAMVIIRAPSPMARRPNASNIGADANPRQGAIMSKAARNSTTNTNPSATLGDLTPTSCKYVGADEILVSLTTATGDVVTFSLTTAMLMQMTNLSVKLINNFTAQVLRDLGAI